MGNRKFVRDFPYVANLNQNLNFPGVCESDARAHFSRLVVPGKFKFLAATSFLRHWSRAMSLGLRFSAAGDVSPASVWSWGSIMSATSLAQCFDGLPLSYVIESGGRCCLMSILHRCRGIFG
jgi:hypothetical protein